MKGALGQRMRGLASERAAGRCPGFWRQAPLPTLQSTGANPMGSFDAPYADGIAPKVYVGLFGDSSVAVLDTACNHVLKTIPLPAGPHGLVMTPDGKRVYASSDGDSVVSVISTATDEIIASIDVGSAPHRLSIPPHPSPVLFTSYASNK